MPKTVHTKNVSEISPAELRKLTNAATSTQNITFSARHHTMNVPVSPPNGSAQTYESQEGFTLTIDSSEHPFTPWIHLSKGYDQKVLWLKMKTPQKIAFAEIEGEKFAVVTYKKEFPLPLAPIANLLKKKHFLMPRRTFDAMCHKVTNPLARALREKNNHG